MQSNRPRAWDGTGHFALAQIYDQSIFPDTFGWTHAYFAGMPFPNFYPPLFYWLVALLHHTHLFSFPTAFKLVVSLPILMMPLAIWAVTWKLTGRDKMAAAAAAFGGALLLTDYRFITSYPPGLDYFSTFQIGLYAQPLGFVLLLAWFVAYLDSSRKPGRFAVAATLLALTILANFFNAVTAALLIGATVGRDLLKCCREPDSARRREWRGQLIAHAASPFVALCLAGFWLVPMLSQFDYFVTRPNVVPFTAFVPPLMWVWYALAAAGAAVWLRHPTAHAWPYLIACAAVAAGLIVVAPLAPRWFPLQSNRFVSTLNFLLTVPVGRALAEAFRAAAAWVEKFVARRSGNVSRGPGQSRRDLPSGSVVVAATALALFAGGLALIRPAVYGLAFFPTENRERVDLVLDFAREHQDGRYLVEVPHISYPAAQLDGRAISSYIGAQGGEALSVVFREASPNAVFFNPLVNVFSAYPDSYGFSSVLADDRDFAARPLAEHLGRARHVGARYLVIISPRIKERLDKEEDVAARYDLGAWSVFKLRGEPARGARVLAYKPALVVSLTSFKARRRNEYDFVRFAEEQFADGHFDVLLARAPQQKIDLLQHLDRFGSLIVDTYDHEDEGRAYELLRTFALSRPLVLLSSDAALFRRIKANIGDFTHITLVERRPEDAGPWLEAEQPTHHYDSSSVRTVWHQVRSVVERYKIRTAQSATPEVKAEVGRETIDVKFNVPVEDSLPVLLDTTFHPAWRRTDGETVYAVTPFFMMTFARESARLAYTRRWFDWLGLAVSALTVLILWAGYFARRKLIGSVAKNF